MASTANLTLSSSQTIDGIGVTSGFRVLVGKQTDTTENGIWLSDSSTWTRAKDFDTSRDIMPGTLCYVDRGTAYAASYWVVNSSSTSTSISIGSTAISFSRVNTSLSGVSAFMQTVLDDTSAANARTTLGSGAAGDALFTSTTTAAARTVIAAMASTSTASIGSTTFFTAAGSLIMASSTGVALELGIGSSGAHLFSYGSTAVWSTAVYFLGTFTYATTSSGTNAITGVGFKPKIVEFKAMNTSSRGMSVGQDDGTTAASLAYQSTVLGYAAFAGRSVWLQNQSTADVAFGNITTVSTDGFTFSWISSGASGGTATVHYIAQR